jgi:hypothetical protein
MSGTGAKWVSGTASDQSTSVVKSKEMNNQTGGRVRVDETGKRDTLARFRTPGAIIVLIILAYTINTLIAQQQRLDLSLCPGYTVVNISQTPTGLTADLRLAGNNCDVHGTDIDHLTLTVDYDTGR